MESTQNLKKRLKSVNNINQITKAMELVAATKMRKSQEIALASRPYALAVLDLLANISRLEVKLPKLILKRKIKKTCILLVTSDKGLAGAFNTSLLRKFEKFLAESKIKESDCVFAAVGEKSKSYLLKRGNTLMQSFNKAGDFTMPEETEPIAQFLAQGYLDEKWDRAIVFSTNFKSALRQEAIVREVLPIDFESIKEAVANIIPETGKFAELIREKNLDFSLEREELHEYLIEPSSEEVLEKAAQHLFFMQIYHLILEANASEHAARRTAMKSASDNAKELSQKLNLQYNKSRQAAITKELIEITSGVNSL